jgi:hypothetical protein
MFFIIINPPPPPQRWRILVSAAPYPPTYLPTYIHTYDHTTTAHNDDEIRWRRDDDDPMAAPSSSPKYIIPGYHPEVAICLTETEQSGRLSLFEWRKGRRNGCFFWTRKGEHGKQGKLGGRTWDVYYHHITN